MKAVKLQVSPNDKSISQSMTQSCRCLLVRKDVELHTFERYGKSLYPLTLTNIGFLDDLSAITLPSFD